MIIYLVILKKQAKMFCKIWLMFAPTSFCIRYNHKLENLINNVVSAQILFTLANFSRFLKEMYASKAFLPGRALSSAIEWA